MPAQTPPSAGLARHYGLDWLRIGVFALLILHHIGMYFVVGDWVVKTDRPVAWIAFPMLFVTPWRLGLLFLIAGFASAALLGKMGSAITFARLRSVRLLLPLGFAMAFVIPPQSWVRLIGHNGYREDFGYFWLHDNFRFGLVDGIALPAWEHLWFLFYLWAFTMVLVAALLFAPRWIAALREWVTELLSKGHRLLWLPLLYFVPIRAAVTFTVSETHGLFNDWAADILYLPLFLFGFSLAHAPHLWPAIARVFRPALVVALCCFAGLLSSHIAHPDGSDIGHLPMAADRMARGGMLWSMMIVMLHVGATLLNRDHRWRARLSEAIFPAYIIHQTTVVAIGWWLLSHPMPLALQFLLVLSGTVLSCIAFYLLARSLPWLAPFAGLSPNKRRASGPIALPSEALAQTAMPRS